MKTGSVLAAALACLVCAAGLQALKGPARPEDGRNGGQAEFYADKVVDHINVVAPENALGEPDGRLAEIRAGGELTVHMEHRIYYSEGSDDGAVVTKGESAYGLGGLIRMSEEAEFAWLPLVPGHSPGGFKLSTDMFAAPQTTDTIRIVNDGTRPVFVDAVIGFKKALLAL